MIDLTEATRVEPPAEFPSTPDQIAALLKSKSTHIFIAVPCYGCRMNIKFLTSLLRLESFCLVHGIRLTFEFIGNESLITRGRCILAERAMKSNATHLLFIDADIAFDVITVLRLAAFNAPVTAGIYSKKGLDFNNVIAAGTAAVENGSEPDPIKLGAKLADAALGFNLNLAPGKTNHVVSNGFIEVLDAATGMMMIRLDSLRALREIYYDDLRVANDIPSSRDIMPEYVALFETFICPDTRRFLSEDYAFCRKCQTNGMRVFADLTAPLVHVGELTHTSNLSKMISARLEL